MSHHRHTGKVLHRQHTSHAVLVVLVLASLTVVFLAVRIENSNSPAVAGDITLTGSIPGPPPSEPPIIDEPGPGDSFGKSPIDISGRRPGDNIVEIYHNGIFSGAAGCTAGTFRSKVSLINGSNEIRARQVDANGQYGPFSAPFTVGFLPKLATGAKTSQFYLVPSAAYFGRKVGQSYPLEGNLFGGKAPYAIKIGWGDGGEKLLSLAEAGRFGAEHAYSQPGCYVIDIAATDNQQNQSSAQTVVLISGDRKAPGLALIKDYAPGVIWPLLALAFGVIATFWLGERYEIERSKESGDHSGEK